MSTNFPLNEEELPLRVLTRVGEIETLVVEPDQAVGEEDTLFLRHQDIPGHHQEALSNISVVMAGAGGLNSLAAVGLLRSGLQRLTVIDPDVVERSNLSRQYYFSPDLNKPKATRLIHNLAPHAIAGATLQGISMHFEEAMQQYTIPCDLMVIGVDRNDCRFEAARMARRMGIPAVFTMLSEDGMRCHCFLQRPFPTEACLWCALPNLDPSHAMPCAAAVITSCLLASACTIFFVHRALMGWPRNVRPFNFRDVDLMGATPDFFVDLPRRPNCPVCGDLQAK